jgi:hypothetical protein
MSRDMGPINELPWHLEGSSGSGHRRALRFFYFCSGVEVGGERATNPVHLGLGLRLHAPRCLRHESFSTVRSYRRCMPIWGTASASDSAPIATQIGLIDI